MSRGTISIGYPTEASSIKARVDRYGFITQDTLTELLTLLATKTDYEFHVAVEISVGALLKTVDNEKDAQETIRRLRAKK